MPKKNQDPIIVTVKGDRYECHGNPTARSTYLYSMLQKLGGISEGVPDGTYHFNVKRKGFRLEASLLPIED